MARVLTTGRVIEAQAAMLRRYADDTGLPFYQATVRVFEIGIAELTGTGLDRRPHGAETGVAAPSDPEIATALHDARDVIDTLARQAGFSNRLTRRTLYMACGAQAATIARSRGTLDMLDAVEAGATTERMFTA